MINEIDEFLNDEIKETKKQEIIIDIEIKERLWKLNETEYNNLKESILNDGCRESLILWNNILIIFKKKNFKYSNKKLKIENLFPL